VKTDAIWIGRDKPERYALKKDIPPQNPGVRAIRVEFRFEVAYILMDERKRVKFPCGWGQAVEFWTSQGHLIGLRDLAAADHTKYQEVWRGCVDNLIREELGL
jgi:hypothetical protein